MSTTLEIPDKTVDGKYLDDDGRAWVIREAALSMGFTPPFLKEWQGKAHPALGHKLTVWTKQFRENTANGQQRCYRFVLFLQRELQTLLRARETADKVDTSDWPTVQQAAAGNKNEAQRLRTLIRAGRIMGVTVKIPKKTAQGVQFVKALRVDPDELKKLIPEDKVSLPDAARKSGIPLATWHTWTRRPCPLIGRKLATTMEWNRSHHNHYRPMDHITLDEFQTVVERWSDAQRGRHVQGAIVYLSPLVIGKEFVLPLGSPASMTLANHRRHGSPKLGRPVRSIKANYLDGRNKLTYGECYAEPDVEQLWPRKEKYASRRANETAQLQIQAAAAHSTVILGEFGEQPTVNGKLKVALAHGAYGVVQALLNAGDQGLSKDELEKVNTGARKILRQLCNDQDWAAVIKRPGLTGPRKYRIPSVAKAQ